MSLVSLTEETQITQSVAKIVAFSEEEAAEVEKNIEIARAAARGSQEYNKNEWYFGSTLYMEINLKVSTKTVGGRTLYRIDSIEASSTVNSGTSLNSRILRMGAMGVGENEDSVVKREEVNIVSASMPYRTTTTASWPYISEGAQLGASIECSVSRASGDTKTFTLSNNIFNN